MLQFGDTSGEEWAALVSHYTLPLDADGDDGLAVLGIGGAFSGVSFHTHGAAFSESIVGRKRWFLTPPDAPPQFSGTQSQLSWLVSQFPRAACSALDAPVPMQLQPLPDGASIADAIESLTASVNAAPPAAVGTSQGRERTSLMQMCTVEQGEVIYIPPQWHHATLNVGTFNVFVSAFTLESTLSAT